MEYIKALIRDIPDFPKEGIIFKDITPVLNNLDALTRSVDLMAAPFFDKVDKVVGIESRGFIFGVPISMELQNGFIPVRKPGKLPYDAHAVTYDTEYSTDTLEMHIDAIQPGDRVLIVDDLLATGGTALATKKLVEDAGGIVVGFSFLIELNFLGGRQKISDTQIHSVISY